MSVLLLLLAGIAVWIFLLKANPRISEKPKNLESDFYFRVNVIKAEISRCKDVRQLDFISDKYFVELRIHFAKIDRAIMKRTFLDLWGLWYNQRMAILFKK